MKSARSRFSVVACGVVVAAGVAAPAQAASDTVTRTIDATGMTYWCKPNNSGANGGVLTVVSGTLAFTMTVSDVTGGQRLTGTISEGDPIVLQDGQGALYDFDDFGSGETFDQVNYTDGSGPTGIYRSTVKFTPQSSPKNQLGTQVATLRLNGNDPSTSSVVGSCGSAAPAALHRALVARFANN